MRILRKALASAVVLAALVAGCSKPGSEYVGKWVNAGNSMDTMQITRNGDQFQIAGPEGPPVVATFSESSLHVPMPMGSIDMKYDKGTDTIQTPGLFGTTQYKRSK
jgi:hypothetical protein